jgi:branched-chain amino acid transport system substrate-binding protein
VEFRRALRDAIEGTSNLAAAHGIFNLTPNDHQGYDQRARVMATIENNTWKLVK